MSVADVKRVKPILRFFAEMTNQKEFENLEDRLLAEKRKGVKIPMCTFTQGLADKDISTLSAVPLSTVQKIKAQLASNTDNKPDKMNSF